MDISNKFLLILLVITIVITLIGTWYAVDRLNKLTWISASDVFGYVNISISNLTTINVTASNCNFGSGYVTPPESFAVVRSGGSGSCQFIADSENWTNTSAYDPHCMEVRNDGNINLVVNVSSGKTVANMIGGTSPNITAWSQNKEIGACYSGTLNTYPGEEMDTGNKTMCTCLWPDENFDEIYVGCELTIPDNAYGTKGDVWTFWASPSGVGAGGCSPS